MSDHTDEILFEEDRNWGIITLNRPKALNALTHKMVIAMRAKLDEWARADHIRAVMIRGAGEKSFCAGGDIRWLYEEAKRDASAACGFFHDEYLNNAAIFHFPKPYVALIDGITMGGGVGVSVHGDFRVVGDRTLFAMPETGIGLFPDVGGGYFMPRLKGGLGLYYGLTGARAKTADCLATGIATHYVPSEKQQDMIEKLLDLKFSTDNAHADVAGLLTELSMTPDDAPIETMRADIERLFMGHDNFDDLLSVLEKDGSDFANETYKTLSRMSPTSLYLTFAQMHKGVDMAFNDVMAMEYRIVSRVMTKHDFFEGVRALIIDKDKSPNWLPSSITDVDKASIANYFMPLENGELPL